MVRKSKEVVQILEVLLVIYPSVVMVLLVPRGSAQNLWKEPVGHKRQIIPAVRLAQQIRHQHIVRQPTQHVLLPNAAKGGDLLHEDVHCDLKETVNVGMLHGFKAVEGVR